MPARITIEKIVTLIAEWESNGRKFKVELSPEGEVNISNGKEYIWALAWEDFKKAMQLLDQERKQLDGHAHEKKEEA